jgi:hypothetical protein
MLSCRSRRVLLQVIALALVSAPAARAQGSVTGVVTSQATKEALSGGRVMLVGTSVTTCIGLSGRYVFTNIAPGTVQVRILAVPYVPTLKTVTVTDGAVAILNAELPGAGMMTQGGGRAGPPPTAAQHISDVLFKGIDNFDDSKPDSIAARWLAAQHLADPKSPDYLGTLSDLADKRNAELKALLRSDADRATFAENVKRNPDIGCPAP